MSIPVPEKLQADLRAYTQKCMEDPSILYHPNLAELKELIEHFGGKIPPKESEESDRSKSESAPTTSDTGMEQETEVQPESESEESDIELDMTGVIEPDTDAPQKMGNPTVQPTEEEIAESQEKRSQAVSAFVEKDYEKALELYTEAIVLNPHAALLYAKRGQVFLLLNKPNACIRDCDRALELNPDSAAAHKFRGRANQLLGNWEEAANDLRLACKFDFDEQADEWLREVTPNAKLIEEHKRKKERRAAEKLLKERQEKLKKARAEAKAREDNTRPSQTEGPGGVSGAFNQFLNDADVLRAFLDPEVAEAFNDISQNPPNIYKYQHNPKIGAVIDMMATKFAAAGADGSRCPGFPTFPGFPNVPPSASATTQGEADPPKPSGPGDDLGLD
ncbi:putative protein FAM10A4 [Orussus abietinus]|uniref:putative protein FAM10A4 n=1 Tax=Orussus abietinus TaxID=222816 RepID=UPI000625297E|nr:putative protein FAM10A4 [Orussus abietinus]